MLRLILNNFKEIREWQRLDHSKCTRANMRGDFRIGKHNNKYGRRKRDVCARQIFNKLPMELLRLERESNFKQKIKAWIRINVD